MYILGSLIFILYSPIQIRHLYIYSYIGKCPGLYSEKKKKENLYAVFYGQFQGHSRVNFIARNLDLNRQILTPMIITISVHYYLYGFS